MRHHHDPATDPEDEGIPDLTDGSPGAERAEDPQRMPVPGDEPTAVDRHGVTDDEQREGEPLDERLAEEEPDEDEAPPDEDEAVPEHRPGQGLAPEESAVRVLHEEPPSGPARAPEEEPEGRPGADA